MGGRLRCDDDDGRATFTVELPLAPAVGQPHVTAPVDDAAPLRFLVVDDNRLNVLVAVKLLARLSPGAVIDTAPDGAAALARVQAAPYHLILMDMQMPVMDGEAATREIRALADPARAAIPIVAMTANTDSADLQRCLDAGMNQTLAKPVTALSLRQIVRAHLGRGAISSDKWPRVPAT
ncbi:MAG: response regulator [Kofleriaceae bacterium]